MSKNFENEPMLEIFIYETTQIIDQLEQVIMNGEKAGTLLDEDINEIFRYMHTIKGSAAMMLFNNIATVAHKMEDLFYFIREKGPKNLDYGPLLDKVLEGVDFIKVEMIKIKNFDEPDGDSTTLEEVFKNLLDEFKANTDSKELDDLEKPKSDKKMQYYIPQEKKASSEVLSAFKINIRFTDGCEMENVRAYTVVFGLADLVKEIYYYPSSIAEDENTSKLIKEQGFEIFLKTNKEESEIEAHLNQTIYLDSLVLETIDEDEFQASKNKDKINQMPQVEEDKLPLQEKPEDFGTIGLNETVSTTSVAQRDQLSTGTQSMISVHVEKLDNLMNMVGELVIAEAMVTQNPVSELIESESYQKAARQLHKITGELQDMVMAIRMVPLSTTFIKMNRIVRDMSKKLNKEVELVMYGEETEVDKNIIEHISDPLMHIIRNAIDHGIENDTERLEKGKPKVGKIILEAKNAGSDVLIVVKDDGKGLSRDNILKKARVHGLIDKNDNELSDREVFNLIMLPGFSTKDEVTEFSGRGVGMDVVVKNLEAVGGTVVVDSEFGKGSTITLKIPLTLAIIEGMNIRVGESRFTIPITTIKESFRPIIEDCINDPDNNEMVMVRGQCYPILRLHKQYDIRNAIDDFTEGIMIMVEQDEKVICVFADELLGQQQVVVKTLPHFIKATKKILGLAGCTLLGDGNISLILDINGLTSLRVR